MAAAVATDAASLIVTALLLMSVVAPVMSAANATSVERSPTAVPLAIAVSISSLTFAVD